MASENRPDAVQRAERKVDDVTGAPDDRQKYAERRDVSGDTDALEGQQRQETSQAWAGPGLPASSDAQWKGLVTGSLVGGAIGLVLLLPVAFIPFGFSLTGRLLMCGVIGALAGGTAGALYFGGRMPELEGETVDADGTPSVGTTPRDRRTDDRGR
ncbi:MAG: hypothetical protein M3N25_06870 [Actinomycetota bacterium]|nr:hypothetical protein [Actinomycetota bacterium]MDP9020507.1 hypothetical protein [Actinomycetota bacterium]